MSHIDIDEPSILAMGGFGNPRYLCPDCDKKLQTAIRGEDYDSIVAAMNSLSGELVAKNIDDNVTVKTVTDLLDEGAKRAKAIKEGSYDFSLDDREDEEGMDELPTELLESEEDKALDAADAEKMRKFDKVMNWIWIAVCAGTLAGIIYFVINLCI